MTYEEKILKAAEKKCIRIYKYELTATTTSMAAVIMYIFTLRYPFLIITALCLIICAACEAFICHIDRQAKKLVARRMKILNRSLEITIRPFSQSRLIIEKIEFDREYGFLKRSDDRD